MDHFRAAADPERIANAAITNDAFALASSQQSPVIVGLGKINWPAGLDPVVATFGAYTPDEPITGSVAADADVLIILDTDNETRAFLDVFTQDNEWTPARMKTWYPYRDPAVGYFYALAIGSTRVVLYKTLLHPKDDGVALPFVPVITEIVSDLSPALVLATGTAGGIGTGLNCGDVAICNSARFLVKDNYAGFPVIEQLNHDGAAITNDVQLDSHFLKYAAAELTQLSLPGLAICYDKFNGNPDYTFLKKNVEPPALYATNALLPPAGQSMVVVSSDYMTVDDAHNYEGLQGLGIVTETEDAFASYAIQQLPSAKRPKWLSVRNVSDPQITGDSFPAGTPKEAISKKLGALSGAVFGIYQYCTTLNSAFACWALVATFDGAKSKVAVR